MNNCPLLPLQATANQESSRAQQQCREHVHALEAQLAALETARVADQVAAERQVVSEGRTGASCSELGNTPWSSFSLSNKTPAQTRC